MGVIAQGESPGWRWTSSWGRLSWRWKERIPGRRLNRIRDSQDPKSKGVKHSRKVMSHPTERFWKKKKSAIFAAPGELIGDWREGALGRHMEDEVLLSHCGHEGLGFVAVKSFQCLVEKCYFCPVLHIVALRHLNSISPHVWEYSLQPLSWCQNILANFS